jgi:hypothetical protein
MEVTGADFPTAGRNGLKKSIYVILFFKTRFFQYTHTHTHTHTHATGIAHIKKIIPTVVIFSAKLFQVLSSKMLSKETYGSLESAE